ncbi:MAG: hypothetical protein FVQ77_13710 [Cytophagales bacterium]|nr:hypothetical protein [Cytophagales bacterium]
MKLQKGRLLSRCSNFINYISYLFEGQRGGKYSGRSVVEIVKRAAKNAGIGITEKYVSLEKFKEWKLYR